MPRNPNQPRPKDTRTAPKDKKAKEAAAAPGPAATAPAAAPSTSGAAEPKPKRLKVNLPTSLAAAIPNEVTTRLGELEAQRKRLTDQLRDTEKQIFELESRYLEISNPQGNALKGYDTLLATGAAALKAQLSDEDRIFSGSSLTGLSHGRN